jgi:hypothetical protein
VFVGDRSNSRIQIFDSDAKLLAERRQFGRPSSVFIDKNDTIYVAASQSSQKRNPGFKQGIKIGSVKDGKVAAFIPLLDSQLQAAEAVTADDQGKVYGGFTTKRNLKKFVQQ